MSQLGDELEVLGFRYQLTRLDRDTRPHNLVEVWSPVVPSPRFLWNIYRSQTTGLWGRWCHYTQATPEGAFRAELRAGLETGQAVLRDQQLQAIRALQVVQMTTLDYQRLEQFMLGLEDK